MSIAVELVVTDLDGTLSDAGERVHPRTVQAMRALGGAGVPVLVATGRRPRTAALLLEAAGLRGPAWTSSSATGRRPIRGTWPAPWVARDDLPRTGRTDPVLSFTVVAGGSPDAMRHADHIIGPPASGGWAAILDLVRPGSLSC